MARINDLPTEVLLEVEKYLDHPFLFKGNALARTCMPMWRKLGGKEVYRRAARVDRDRTLRAQRICQALIEEYTAWGRTEKQREDMRWLTEMARRGAGPTDKIDIAWAFQASRGIAAFFAEKEGRLATAKAKSQCKMDGLTGKTLLNRAIVQCGDIAQIGEIIDAYIEIFPAAFTGACCGPLLELVPIHAAVRAKRPDAVQLLVSKGLAPPYVDSFFIDGEVKVAWYGDYRWLEASPFNVALSERDEDICLALVGGGDEPLTVFTQGNDRYASHLADDDAIEEGNISRDVKLARYLKMAEHNKMYRLIPALLQHWKRVCPDHVYSPRRILDLMSISDGQDEILGSRFARAGDGDGWQHTINALLGFGEAKSESAPI